MLADAPRIGYPRSGGDLRRGCVEDVNGMAVDFGLVYPPWNHTKAAGNLLDRVVGEVGIDHLTIPVVTGEQTQFRLIGGFESPYFHTEGGWHFPPQTKLYTASGVRPRTAKWLGSRDPIADIREVAEKLGLRVILRVDLSRVRQIAEHAPQMSVRGAWDEPRPSFGPCPCNPDFRELLHATLKDIVRYEPAGIAVQGIQTDPVALVEPPAESTRLFPVEAWLGLCFCPACRQIATAAGIDADAVAELTREKTKTMARHSPAKLVSQRRDPGDGEPDILTFRAARAANLRQWLGGLAEAHAPREMILVHTAAASYYSVYRDHLLVGPNWTVQLRTDMEAALFPAMLAGDTSQRYIHEMLSVVKGHRTLAVLVGNFSDASTLVTFVSQAAQSGVDLFSFENLEQAPPKAITWIKQAVRFARRD